MNIDEPGLNQPGFFIFRKMHRHHQRPKISSGSNASCAVKTGLALVFGHGISGDNS
jgi:hypothetical protein